MTLLTCVCLVCFVLFCYVMCTMYHVLCIMYFNLFVHCIAFHTNTYFIIKRFDLILLLLFSLEFWTLYFALKKHWMVPYMVPVCILSYIFCCVFLFWFSFFRLKIHCKTLISLISFGLSDIFYYNNCFKRNLNGISTKKMRKEKESWYWKHASESVRANSKTIFWIVGKC